MKDFMKDTYEVIEKKLQLIEKKLQLAELTIQLGQVTREKWARLETMRDILNKEESLLKKELQSA